MKPSVATLAIAAGLAVLPSCANAHGSLLPAAPPTTDSVPGLGTAVSAPPGFPTANSGGRQRTHVADFADADVQLDPPGADVQPTFSATAAYNTCATAANARCDEDHAPTITFALATSEVGGRVQADGSVKRRLNATPAWILYWSGLSCYPVSGGPLKVGEDPAATEGPKPCTKVAVIDATTGQYLWTEQDIPKP